MTSVLRPSTAATVLLSTLILSGCGGGTESGSSNVNSGGASVPAIGARLSVDTANYQAVAIDAIGSAVQFSSQTVLAALVDLPVSRTTLACAGSGSIELAAGDADRSGRIDAAGENVALTFHDCIQGGSRLNGRLTLGLTATPSGSVAGGSYAVAAVLLLSNLSVDDGQVRLVASGPLTLSSSRSASGTGRDRIGTSALALSVTPAGGATAVYALHGYDADLTLNAGALAATYAGTLTSSRLGDRSVVFATTTPFVTAPGAVYPNAGVAIAMGSGGSKATLTVLDAAQVRLDLDTGGDGTVESTVTRPWTSLL